MSLVIWMYVSHLTLIWSIDNFGRSNKQYWSMHVWVKIHFGSTCNKIDSLNLTPHSYIIKEYSDGVLAGYFLTLFGNFLFNYQNRLKREKEEGWERRKIGKHFLHCGYLVLPNLPLSFYFISIVILKKIQLENKKTALMFFFSFNNSACRVLGLN